MTASRSSAGWLLVLLGYLGFISIGLPDGLLGVAWPSIRAGFGLGPEALGRLLLLFTLGYLASSFSSGRILARISVGSLLSASCALTGLVLIGYALAPAWPLLVAFGLVAGLGAGAIDAGLNTYAATHYGARALNWLHACYGVGATLGSLLMTQVLMTHSPWQWGYAGIAFAQLALAACFLLTRRQWAVSGATQAEAGLAPLADTLRLPAVWFAVALFFVYTGLEAAVGIWSFSLFTEARGIPMDVAGGWVSLYWGCLTAGRVLLGFVVGQLPETLLLRLCMLGLATGALLVWLNPAGLPCAFGLALMGFSAAAIFPTLIALTPAWLGAAHTANAIGFQIAAAVLGQSLLPAGIGLLAAGFTLEVVAPALLAAALLVPLLFEGLVAGARRAPQLQSSPMSGA